MQARTTARLATLFTRVVDLRMLELKVVTQQVTEASGEELAASTRARVLLATERPVLLRGEAAERGILGLERLASERQWHGWRDLRAQKEQEQAKQRAMYQASRVQREQMHALAQQARSEREQQRERREQAALTDRHAARLGVVGDED